MSSTNAYNVGGNIISMEAENTMSERFVVVELGTSEGQVDLPSATSDLPFGIIQETANQGQAVPVQIDGISQCVAGSAITAGAKVYIEATDGRVDDVDTGTCVGLALTGASAEGEIILVDLTYKGAA